MLAILARSILDRRGEFGGPAGIDHLRRTGKLGGDLDRRQPP